MGLDKEKGSNWASSTALFSVLVGAVSKRLRRVVCGRVYDATSRLTGR